MSCFLSSAPALSAHPPPLSHGVRAPHLSPVITALAWEIARGIVVLGAIHLDLPQPQLYVSLPYAVRTDIQRAIRLPVARVVADPSDLAAWHILFLFPLWCLALPVAHDREDFQETRARLYRFLAGDRVALQ